MKNNEAPKEQVLLQIEDLIHGLRMKIEKDKDSYFLYIDRYDFGALRNFDEQISGYEQTLKFVRSVSIKESASGKEVLKEVVHSMKTDWLPDAEKRGSLFNAAAQRVFARLSRLASENSGD